MLRTNPVAHAVPVTVVFRVHLPRKTQNPFPNGAFFPGKSVNDVLHIWESTSLVSDAVTTHSASNKRKIFEIDDDVDDVISQSGSENLSEKHVKSFHHRHFHPLVSCQAPNQLWHLRFGHASTTTLHKLRYIKSSHDSTRCVICIRSKQTRKPFLPSARQVSQQLERIHSDICGPFPTSKGLTKLLLTFLDEATLVLDHYNRRQILGYCKQSRISKAYMNQRLFIRLVERQS
jgi:hypothetical protein